MSTKRRVGRPRKSACFKEHFPGQRCAQCARVAQRAWRAKDPAVEKRRVRTRSPLEIQAAAARAYVSTYLRRKKIHPPLRCDFCNEPARVQFWHPDPSHVKTLVWLCPRDRKRVPSLGEPVVARWKWPGAAAPPTKIQPARVLRDRRYIACEAETPVAEARDADVVPMASATLAQAPALEAAPVSSRAELDAWLSRLDPAAAEAIRVRASTVLGRSISRESPLYSQQLLKLHRASLERF